MVSGPELQELVTMANNCKYDDVFASNYLYQPNSVVYDQQSLVGSSYNSMCVPSQDVNFASSLATRSHEGDPAEDGEIFSDISLTYISRMLLEEDIDEKVNMYQQQAALRATEKPFYDILGEEYPYPLLPDKSSFHFTRNLDRLDCGCGGGGGGVLDHRQSHVSPVSISSSCSPGVTGDCSSQSSFSLSSGPSNVAEEPLVLGIGGVLNMFVDSRHAWHFRKGVEEAKKFLPSDDKLVIDLEACGFSQQEASKQRSSRVAQVDVVDKRDCANTGSRSRKKPNGEDLAMQEGRNNKQSAVCSEETLPSEMFDKVLLYNKNESLKVGVDAVVANLQDKASKISDGNQLKGSNVGKGHGKKQAKKKVVDLRTLLIHCAQAVAADDRWTANEVLKQIRQHSSPSGDGSQRLAHCFADGLEARLAGTGSQIYRSLIAKKTTASDILKAYQLYLAACPFKRISHFFSNQTILNVSEKASRIHIIDFGIYFGFQWPCLIQRLSYRAGGPPNLRITGIDVAQPGFRPTERIEETGRRLQDYARSFNVPFEFNAITSKWEAITVKDLKIRKDEVLIVNCLYRFRNLVDETVIVDSPRNMVLNTIRQASPDVFIHGIVNGSYSAPFFVTRFREALFHYSALFDMLETTVPREDEQRRLIERDLFGREALNVISCESSERVERPETYKQWQARNLRARFEQLPLDPDIMKRARDKVKTSYHKDFVIDESSRWLLQGWKGRIIYAISTWRPNKVR